MHATRTPAQAKAWLDSLGITIKDFADNHGLDPATTYQVLAGTKKGKRGEAHKAAVLLGIKDGVVAQ
ncbi:DNA-binding protein [Pseudomonas sp. M30-35]|uniref:DNA-binding protein n=2 Tax=Gammaproteobacteria TaxID=1236 RepID=UPI000B3C8338|nr:DNA-binding protein [Pseudomonas sp. M30-35]ARU88271.1 hypothetical protein B9K09_09990 [Pseudomonas sp. M30-35]